MTHLRFDVTRELAAEESADVLAVLAEEPGDRPVSVAIIQTKQQLDDHERMNEPSFVLT